MDLTGIKHLKFTTSKVGVKELESKGWRVLDTLKPGDGQFYYLLGLPAEDPALRIKQLEAELAALKVQE